MKCAGEAGSYRPDQQHPASHPMHQQQAHRFTLAFKDNQLESNFRAWYDEAAAAHDQQAASIYLWMVALGSLLYVIVAAYSPGSRPANVDKCSLLILCSWLGPTAHLLLLRLLPRAVYVRNRTRIILLLRVFYIGATSVNGFGLCGVAPIQDKKATVVAALQMPLPLLQQQQAAAAATAQGLGAGSPAHSPAGGGCSQESPFSALFWRSGVIGLNWWSAAFPLPFAHHIPVQAASVALYVNTLAHAVCSTMHGVRSGGRVLATIHHWARALSSQLMAAVGAAGPSTRYTAAAAMAAAAAEPAAGVNSGSSCVQVLAFVQLVLGMLLPAFVMYHLEAHKRWSWWRNKQRHMAQRGSSSSGSSSGLRSPAGTAAAARGDDVPATSTASLATLEAAAVAALAAAGWDLGPSPCKTRATGEAAAAKAKGDDVVRTDGSSSSSSSSCSSSNASCSSSGSNGGGRNAATSSRCVETGSSSGSLQSQLSLTGLSARHDQALGRAAATSSTAAAAAAGAPVCGVDEASLLAAVDAFDQTDHSCSDFAPPGLADVFVLLVMVGVSWLVLGQVL